MTWHDVPPQYPPVLFLIPGLAPMESTQFSRVPVPGESVDLGLNGTFKVKGVHWDAPYMGDLLSMVKPLCVLEAF